MLRFSSILRFLWIIAAVAALLCLYSETLGFPFLWDDMPLIVYNLELRNPTWKMLLMPLHQTSPDVPFYLRPIQKISYWMDYSLWGLNAFGYHLVNLLLHSVNMLFLAILLRLWMGLSWGWALGGSLLYALHPLHTATVAYISGRADTLCLAGILSMLLFYLRKKTLFSLLCFLFALGSKEISLMGPFLLLLIALHQAKWRWRSVLWPSLFPFLGVTLGYLLLRWILQMQFSKFQIFLPLQERLISVPLVLLRYVQIFLFPHLPQLSRTILIPVSLTTWWWLLACFGSALLLLFSLWLWKRNPWSRFWLGWIWITMLPHLNIFVPLAYGVADHWLILPGIGFVGLIVQALHRMERQRVWLRIILLAGVILWGMHNAGSTYRYAQLWGSSLDLFTYLVKQDPFHERIRSGYAEELLIRGRFADAAEQSAVVLRYGPENTFAWIMLSTASLYLGNKEQALWAAEQAIQIPGYYQAEAYRTLGTVHYGLGNLSASEEALLKSVQLKPSFALSWISLGKFYREQKNWGKTISAFENLIRIRPEVVSFQEWLAEAYQAVGREKEAQEARAKAEKLKIRAEWLLDQNP